MTDNGINTPIADDETVAVDRRTAMFGGAALVGAALGGFSGAEAQTAPAGGMFRRVLVGNNAEGKSYQIKDEMVKAGDRYRTGPKEPLGPIAPGDLQTMIPSDHPEGEPPPGGTQTYFLTFMPTGMTREQVRAALPKGWDRTGSVVHVMPLDNEITYIHDIGETTVKPGELIVLRNSRHATYNGTNKPTRVLAIKILG